MNCMDDEMQKGYSSTTATGVISREAERPVVAGGQGRMVGANSEAASGGRFRFVDGLRGVAAMMVVLYHLAGRTSADWLVSKGYLGVYVFFVLSGYVITMAIGEREVTLGFAGRFAARRSLRLDPPYWISIAVALALMFLAAKIGVPKVFPRGTGILAHLFYVQDVLGVPPISAVYWSLCLEIQFYLFLLALLWICRQSVNSNGFKSLLAVLLVLSLAQHANLLVLTPRGVFLPYWYGFAAGAVTYWASAGRIAATYFAATLLMLLVAVPFAHGEAVLITAVTALLLHMASQLGRMEDWLSGPIMQFLGRTSYSLYLFHALIGWSAQSFALRHVNQWAALGIGISSSLIVAAVAYFAIERPAIRLSHIVRIEPRR